MTPIEQYKSHLKLGTVSSKFYDFLVEYFQFTDSHEVQYIAYQLMPWMKPNDEKVHPLDTFEVFSQFYSDWVHQKYRLALEFAAKEAGFDPIVYDPESLRPLSSGLFWFRGVHPDPVYWIMIYGGRVIAKGGEDPNTLHRETLESWLLDKVMSFAKLNKDLRDGTIAGLESSRESGS